MSRKDYIEAARILRETDLNWRSRNELIDRFSTMFADDNPRFSRTKFREAAGYVERTDVPTLEIATTKCPECGEDRARGDATRIVYCGACGQEWHPQDADYPTEFRTVVR